MYIYKYRYEFLNNAYIFVVSFDLCPPNQPQHTPRRIYRPRFSRQTSDPLTYCVVHLNTAFLTILRRKTKEKRKTRNDTHTLSSQHFILCARVQHSRFTKQTRVFFLSCSYHRKIECIHFVFFGKIRQKRSVASYPPQSKIRTACHLAD